MCVFVQSLLQPAIIMNQNVTMNQHRSLHIPAKNLQQNETQCLQEMLGNRSEVFTSLFDLVSSSSFRSAYLWFEGIGHRCCSDSAWISWPLDETSVWCAVFCQRLRPAALFFSFIWFTSNIFPHLLFDQRICLCLLCFVVTKDDLRTKHWIVYSIGEDFRPVLHIRWNGSIKSLVIALSLIDVDFIF